MIGLVTRNLNFGDKAIRTRILSDTHQLPFRNRERDIDRRRLGNRHHRRCGVWLNQITGGHCEIAGLAGDRSTNCRIAELNARVLDSRLLGFLRCLQIRYR